MRCTYMFLLLFVAYANISSANDKDGITIFAAASMQDALIEHAQNWAKEHNVQMPRFSVGASAIMARQIAAGAPADIFISANAEWAHFLETKGFLKQSPIPLVSNSLVLVTPTSFQATKQPEPSAAYIKSLIRQTRLALADPMTAPAGAYAKTFLKKIDIWAFVKDRVAYTTNVRQALLLAERGGLPAIVYGSDAARSKHVKALFVIPEKLSGPIIYTAGLMKSTNMQAENFLLYLSSPKADPIWQAHGFQEFVSK